MENNQQSLFDFEPLNSAENAGLNNEFEFRTASWLLGLMECAGIGPNKAIAIAKTFRNLDEISAANPDSVSKLLKGAKLDISTMREADATPPEGVSIINYFDDDYPNGLRDLSNPPPVLWFKGVIPSSPSTAVVGTRNPSQSGRNFAHQAGEIASELGIAIVSGLALGIDSAAHQGSLTNNGVNVAVLACDVRFPTPKSNIKLAESILENGGCLVAEVPPGTETESRNLVARNRIQAAWARNLIMAECGIPSGTLHTVRFALEIERPVGVYVSEYQTAGGDSWSGNLALASNSGCEPLILGGSKAFQERVQLRKPCADVLISSKERLTEFIESSS